MVTKRESPVKKTTKRKAASAAPHLTDSAAMVMLESAPSAMRSKSIDPDVRHQLVAAEAYFRAERRGFTAGNELDDWVAAEMAVDTRLQQSQVA
jgi:PBP1b-binding outer membrane lipoprotein LpoB